MLAPKRSNTVYDVIAVSVGTFFFLLFLLVSFRRELGPTSGFAGLFILVMILGAIAAGIGALLSRSSRAQDRRLGLILISEGAVLIVLVLIAWAFMGPTDLPPLN
ncbi:MAG: hypothetical protein N3D11_00740 [Candidatus Sumerlaeia bacterium]|nr:hypothetical protein [Candidatus Sumerlaeia bacterium]